MPDRILVTARPSPSVQRWLTGTTERRRVAQSAAAWMAADSVRYARRHVPVRTGRLKRNISWALNQNRRDATGAHVVIDSTATRRRGRSNASTGPYWRWLLGTRSRFNVRGNVRGGWPWPGWYTGRIQRGKFDKWYERIEKPRTRVFRDAYRINTARSIEGLPLDWPARL